MQKVKTVDYVFGVYNSLIVVVFKPTHWYVCKDAKDKLPKHSIILTEKTENRIFFIDEGYERDEPMDIAQRFYYGKCITSLKVNKNAQNPITYLEPTNKY